LSPTPSASNARPRPSASPRLPEIRDDSLPASNTPESSHTMTRMGLDVNDLELLHFYTTTTSFTLSNRPELQEIWQQVVPRIAFTHQFLLHGILAFAALHLARSQPERKTPLYTEASAHHDVGLRMFRAAMLNITRQNCDACLAFSTIIAAYSWASSDQKGDLFFSDTSISEEEERSNVEWTSLLRGVHTLLDAAGEWITSSSIKLILHPPVIDPELAETADLEVSARLTALSQLWDSTPEKFNVIEVEALKETLVLLHEDCRLLGSSSNDRQIDIVSIVYAWPIKVPGAFLVMVKELRPEALIVLAHYSLLLNRGDKIWYMEGMSRRLLQTIHSKIGKEWESWMAWLLHKLVLTEFQNQEGNKSANSVMSGVCSDV
jgi:hypothetical protein